MEGVTSHGIRAVVHDVWRQDVSGSAAAEAVRDISRRTDADAISDPCLMQSFCVRRFEHYATAALEMCFDAGMDTRTFARIGELIDRAKADPGFLFTPEGIAAIRQCMGYVEATDPDLHSMLSMALVDEHDVRMSQKTTG